MHKRWAIGLPAFLAIALPVLAGLAWMAATGAPRSYLIVNAGSLVLAGAVLATGLPALGRSGQRIALGALLALFALPLLTGPGINEVTRWLPLGPFLLHAGMLAIPALVVLAARDERFGPLAILAALLVALAQPDFASAFALTGGAIGIYQVRGDWPTGLVIIAGFFIAIAAALIGELPPVPFVERVLHDATIQSPTWGAILGLSIVGAVLIMLFGTGLPHESRYPLGLALFGFVLAALMNNYPTPLVGYGAASILGFALAHALAFALAPPQETGP